jgi:hypothetical protein
MKWRAITVTLLVGIIATRVDALKPSNPTWYFSAGILNRGVIQSQSGRPIPPTFSLRQPVSTDVVECDADPGPRQSAVVVSPRGERASVELRGENIPGISKDDDRCRTQWILHITVDGKPRAMYVATQEDGPDVEHYFEIIGWSRDGSLLLMSMISAAGDWDYTGPVIYDTEGQRIWRSDLAEVFDQITPSNCSLYFRPLGFDSNERILIDVSPLDADDLAEGEKPCFEASRWRFDFLRESVEPVSADASIEKFGIVLKRESDGKE